MGHGLDELSAFEFLLTHAQDNQTPIEETLEGLEAICESGRVRFIGACNIGAEKLAAGPEAARSLWHG